MLTIFHRSLTRLMGIIITSLILGGSLAGCTSPTINIPSLPETESTDETQPGPSGTESKHMVTVAPAVFENGTYRLSNEKADYYCTGTDDQIIINSAIQFVSEAFGGGTVQLLEGTFNIISYVDLLSNCKLRGSGAGTIINNINSNTYFLRSIGTAGLYKTNCCLMDMKIIAPGGIYFNYNKNLDIENLYITFDSGLQDAISLEHSDSVIIKNNIIDGESILKSGHFDGIICSETTNILIESNKILNINTDDYFNCIMTIADSKNQIIGNAIYNCSAANAAVGSTGISAKTDYGIISNNKIELLKNTVTTNLIKALYIENTSNLVQSNYCYNNGLDTGIANTNSNNFYDSGTDTQCYSNSWQSPVAGEPSLGTLHPRESDPTAWDVNGILDTSYTLAAPYVWDLTALPVGLTAIDIMLVMYKETTANWNAGIAYAWDYDMGVNPNAFQLNSHRALSTRVSKMMASDFTFDFLHGVNTGWLKVGSSRKIYIGTNIAYGYGIFAMWRGYYS